MSGNAAKTVVLFEMLGLLAAGFLSDHEPGQPWVVQLVTARGLRRLIAVAVLLTLLMLMADVGFGGVAATFGGVLLLSYLAVRGGAFGDDLIALERRAFA